MKHVEGENKGDVLLYAISTCGWCKKTKKLLKKLDVSYNFVDVDLLGDNEKEDIKEQVKYCNPQLSYPTLKINDTCIIGFKEQKIREALEK